MKFSSEVFCKKCDDFFPLIEKMAGYICPSCRTILVHNTFHRNGFEVGDEVIVTSPGNTYDMYMPFADLYQLGDQWVNGSLPETSLIHKIILIAPHDLHTTKLCYVIENIHGKRYIMGADGLKKSSSFLEEELFEI